MYELSFFEFLPPFPLAPAPPAGTLLGVFFGVSRFVGRPRLPRLLLVLRPETTDALCAALPLRRDVGLALAVEPTFGLALRLRPLSHFFGIGRNTRNTF